MLDVFNVPVDANLVTRPNFATTVFDIRIRLIGLLSVYLYLYSAYYAYTAVVTEHCGRTETSLMMSEKCEGQIWLS